MFASFTYEQLNVSPPTTTKNQGNQTQFTRNDDNWVFIDKTFIHSSFSNSTYVEIYFLFLMIWRMAIF